MDKTLARIVPWVGHVGFVKMDSSFSKQLILVGVRPAAVPRQELSVETSHAIRRRACVTVKTSVIGKNQNMISYSGI